MSTKSQGECSEGKILARLLELGYAISLPFGNNQRYDMILDKDGKFTRAQCKTGRLVDGKVTFAVASKHWKTSVRHSYQGQIDVFLVYCPQTEKVYWVPIEITGRSSFNIRITEPISRSNRSRIRWEKDYLL